MGQATLGFPGGPALKFRIDPERIEWNFEINTTVTDTVGGRVVQVLGTTLSDIAITGLFGEDRSRGKIAEGEKDDEHEGRSWRLAQRFASRIRYLMEWQARDALRHDKMHKTAIFSYPPHGWKFRVYVRDLVDPDGGAVQMRTGKFSHGYQLLLFIVADESTSLLVAGAHNGVLNKARQTAINEYIARISEGIGWKPSMYNGNLGTYYDEMFDLVNGKVDETPNDDDTDKAGSAGPANRTDRGANIPPSGPGQTGPGLQE